MNLFDQFKREIPKNQQLVGAVCDSLLNPLDENTIKTSFSSLVEELHDHIYEKYLTAEWDAGNRVISLHFSGGVPSFYQLKGFSFLSHNPVGREQAKHLK
ncbi:MAG: hypothetical protein CL785_06115 [Chloroflexi bacterium]|nr:hypothetical protein [Chloroflexota bacterium]|tara:strand:- start:49276 stop:49575 length:300 start_codon:yes stop_codon:yes gene_type:complete